MKMCYTYIFQSVSPGDNSLVGSMDLASGKFAILPGATEPETVRHDKISTLFLRRKVRDRGAVLSVTAASSSKQILRQSVCARLRGRV
jgi:hypothetical protein